MRVVLDTNVLVSALLTPHGPPARIVRFALAGDIALLHDERILAEYREVLTRARFGFDPHDVAVVLEELERLGEPVLARPLYVTLPDPDDLPFLEVAVAGDTEALVTGNFKHFEPATRSHALAIVTPAELLERLRHA